MKPNKQSKVSKNWRTASHDRVCFGKYTSAVLFKVLSHRHRFPPFTIETEKRAVTETKEEICHVSSYFLSRTIGLITPVEIQRAYSRTTLKEK